MATNLHFYFYVHFILRWQQSRIKGLGGQGQFLVEGPYDVFDEAIVYKRYVFAD